jgi:hypothetical protein
MSATPQYIRGSHTNMADIGFDYPLFLRSVMLNYSIAFPAVSCMGPLYWVLHYKVLLFSNLQYSKTISASISDHSLLSCGLAIHANNNASYTSNVI